VEEFVCQHGYLEQISEQIQYKIAVLIYKVLDVAAPLYLEPLTVDVSGRRTLRSTCANHLVLSFKLSTIGSRAFPVAAAAKIWNALLDSVVSASSIDSLRLQLQTFSQLQQSFCCCWRLSGLCGMVVLIT